MSRMKYNPDFSIESVAAALDEVGTGFLAYVDSEELLVGVVTDGDLRRGLLNGKKYLSDILNFNPITSRTDSEYEVIETLKEFHLRHMPIIDSSGKLIKIFYLDDVHFPKCDNDVVIMAGGLGSRLGELTKNIPKPMLTVGGKPILETLIEHCKSQGFRNFTICVNYRKEVIKDYFKDGSAYGVKIRYIDEEKRLGTAGALNLYVPLNDSPFLVINADIFTTMNFKKLLEYHNSKDVKATVCTREYSYTIPFGVVKYNEDSYLCGLEEKPTEYYQVNAGIYVLSYDAIVHIPMNEFYDMPTLLSDLIDNKSAVATYKVDDCWVDIGRIEDLELANSLFR